MCRPMWKRVSHRASLRFVCLALFIATAPCLSGQEHSVEAGKAAAAQPAERDFRFEVASIRAVEATGFPNMEALRAANFFTPGLYRAEQAGLSSLVAEAFGVKHGYEMEAPRWMNTASFTVNATPPEGAAKADLPILLQHLLEDRFALKYHRESRHISGYELVVVKPSPGLVKATAPAADPSPGKGFEFKDGAPVFAKDGRSTTVCGGPSVTCWMHGHDKTMHDLAEDLAQRLQLPVMDATGLEGTYDYTLAFTPEVYSGPGIIVSPPPPPAPEPTAGGGSAPTPMEHPMLRDALREQLGLELRPVKNVPIDVLVVDSANKVPTEN
jgi:uncharacterized protein (TIGR03435 family)